MHIYRYSHCILIVCGNNNIIIKTKVSGKEKFRNKSSRLYPHLCLVINLEIGSISKLFRE